MSYTNEHLEKIVEINSSIITTTIIDDTISKQIFEYLNFVKSIGEFSIDTWKKEWKKEIYKFGEHFKDINPSKIFSSIDKLIENSNKASEIEVLEFIKSEIYINFFPKKDGIKYFKNLSEKYPINPEFKNSLSICYQNIGKNKKSIFYIKQAIKLDSKNKEWLRNLYQIEYRIAEKLIQNKKHNEADKYIRDIIDSKFYSDHLSDHFQNFFIFLKQRNSDQLLIEKKLALINQNSKDIIDSLFEKTHIKLIEILGFFTAIIAFVFGTVTIAVKVDLHSSLVIISSFGFMMIIFTLSLSIIFIKSDKKWFEDKRLWVIGLIILFNFLLIYFAKSLVTWMF